MIDEDGNPVTDQSNVERMSFDVGQSQKDVVDQGLWDDSDTERGDSERWGLGQDTRQRKPFWWMEEQGYGDGTEEFREEGVQEDTR